MTLEPLDQLISRRELLGKLSCGFGGLALAALCQEARGADRPIDSLVARAPHYRPRARRVIFLFMQGGPSQVDTFDHKEELTRSDGKSINFTGVRFGTFGKQSQRRLMKPLWSFSRYGESGQPVSGLFPEIARHVDDLCFIHSMRTEGVAHGPSTLFLHTGATNLVRPSMGSWVTYGLGTENNDLPGFVTIQPSASKGGPRNYSSAFLPAIYQGTSLGRAGLPASSATIRHLENPHLGAAEQSRQLAFLRELNETQRRVAPRDDRLEATIRSFELAFRMQMRAPEILDISGETAGTRDRYGIGRKETDDFGRQCLLARRLAENGVRFIQVNYADESTTPRWDQHSKMPEHEIHARATDRPVAGLLEDLKERGLLEDTLVWWGGEFGRTPFSQGKDGRDHNPRGFTVWLAGGGVRSGYAHGRTDEIGHLAVESPVHMRDLHATILHLLGLDHERLIFHHAGRPFRLTDVAGEVVTEILARPDEQL